MEFVHFLKSQRYRSRVPLRQLQFTVAVYRAIVVEETNVELLAEVTVPWDGKLFSPLEALTIYKELTQLTQQSTAGEGELRTLTTNAAAPAEAAPLAASAVLGITPAPSSPNATTQPNAAADHRTRTPNALALPTPRELVAQLQKPSSHFFTRPSVEDFIDRAEEDFPVDPPQGPSLLAPVILRQHRRDHQPNRKMFLLWASGDVVLPASAAGPTAPTATAAAAAAGAAATASPPASSSSGAAAVTADAFAANATLPAVEVEAVSWKGIERVLCTLTAETDEHVFTTRPSLNEIHTLFVDAAHIYTFRVTVSKVEAGGPASGRVLADTPNGALDTTASPLDVVLANVRELAHYAEQQYEHLELGRDAVARQLLRQAALLAPPDRATVGPAGTTGGASGSTAGSAAAAAGMALSEDAAAAAGRARRASLNFAASSSAAGERLGMSASHLGSVFAAGQRASGVGGALLARSTMMRGGHALPRGMSQYYLFGTVDRCVGVAESTLFLRCQIVEDGAAAAWLGDATPASPSPSAVCEFSSQLAHIGTFVEDECVLDVDHVFNLPFEHTFVEAAMPSAPLRLIVSAFTEGAAAEGIQSAVGYACVSLPIANPGRHAIRAAMWAPHKSGVEFLRSVLLGGAPSLVDARQTAPPKSHRTGINVKEGLYADSVGSVLLTVNVLHHKNHDAF